MTSTNKVRWLTIGGLVVGAAGIELLAAGGVDFPFYPPPGMLILLAGAVCMALLKKPWAPLIGVALGLFIIIGFLVSPTGIDNLTGETGTTVAIGSVVQLVGVAVAFVAGSVAMRLSYRDERVTGRR